ncbi:MAG: hypothetical protein KDC49_07990 [Saprospiraceae bacterium]|nr:hypothetical protein [Saprospiraceae bacterium]
MNTFQEDIDKFLKGKLSSDEQAKFMAELLSNPDLELEFKKTMLEQDVAEQLIASRLKDEIKSWEKSENPVSKKKSVPYKYIWILTFVLLITLLLFYRIKSRLNKNDIRNQPIVVNKDSIVKVDEFANKDTVSNPYSGDDAKNIVKDGLLEMNYAALANKYYDKSSLDHQFRSVSIETIPQLNTLLEAHRRENYQEILTFLEQDTLLKASNYELYNQFVSDAYFNLGLFDLAAKGFKELAYSEGLDFDYEWSYLISMVGMYAENKTPVNTLIQKIKTDEKHLYHKKAIELWLALGELDR